MLSGEVWPAHPRPYAGECLSSWLVRCAHANGLKVQTFCDRAFGKEHQVWNRDIDRLAPDWLLSVIGSKTATAAKTVDRTTLKPYKGRLFDKKGLAGQLRWILPLIRYHRTYTGFGIQYCPQCLAEDPEPYFRISWRVAYYTFCPYHRVLLYDRCYACSAAVCYQRLELGKPGKFEVSSLSKCWNCGLDLAEAPRRFYQKWHARILREWTNLLKVTDRQFRDCGPFNFFRLTLLHQICRIIVSRHMAPDLQRYICGRTGLQLHPLLLTKRPFEQRHINERHYVLDLAWWLVDRNARKILASIKRKTMPINYLYRDLTAADKTTILKFMSEFDF